MSWYRIAEILAGAKIFMEKPPGEISWFQFSCAYYSDYPPVYCFVVFNVAIAGQSAKNVEIPLLQ